jgi:hypothetical protein
MDAKHDSPLEHHVPGYEQYSSLRGGDRAFEQELTLKHALCLHEQGREVE